MTEPSGQRDDARKPHDGERKRLFGRGVVTELAGVISAPALDGTIVNAIMNKRARVTAGGGNGFGRRQGKHADWHETVNLCAVAKLTESVLAPTLC
jgi:hypothetical protein